MQSNEFIDEQIEQLRKHSHIQSITLIKPFCYKIAYSPQGTNSQYSHMVFNIKLTLDQSYPQKPPYLVFLDKIYHLNIHPVSGVVTMAILKDDWSPYLTLNSVIDGLNSILEEPDQNFYTTESLLDEFTNHKETYQDKIKAVTQFSKNPILQEQNAEIYPAKDLEQVEQIIEGSKISKEHFFNSNETSFQKRADHLDKYNEIKQSLFLSEKDAMKLVEEHSLQSINGKQKQTKKGEKKIEKEEKKEEKQLKEKQSQTLKTKQNKINKTSVILPDKYEDMAKSLKQTNQLIDIFSSQCEEMDKRLKITTNARIKEMLEQKLDKQWTMLEQLFQISSQLKSRLLQLIKRETKQFLK